MKTIVVVLSVCLLAIAIYDIAPQNQANRHTSNNSSGSSTVQSADNWWLMLHTLATSSRAITQNATYTPPNTSQIVPLTNQTLWISGNSSVPYTQDFSCPALSVGEGKIFAVSTAIYALDENTGSVVWWNSSDHASSEYDVPTYANGMVYVGEGAQDYVCALNATTGWLIWSYPSGQILHAAPTVANGTVYVCSDTGIISALNATTGALEWNYAMDTDCWQSATVSGGVVFACSNDQIYALNASTGIVLWTCYLGLCAAAPTVSGGVVYTSGFTTGGGLANPFENVSASGESMGGSILALNASTGAILWNSTSLTVQSLVETTAVSNGLVYGSAWMANLCALNASSGDIVWNRTIGDLYSSPVVADGIVYAGGSHSPSIVGSYGHTHWVSGGPQVYAFNATSGAVIWNYATNYPAHYSSVLDNGVLFIGADNGKIYAFGRPVLAVSISPSYVETDVGTSQAFRTIVVGGSSPYTFQWYVNGAPVSGATDASWTFTPASAGDYTVCLEVTDSLGTLVKSVSAGVTARVIPVFSIVNPGPGSSPSNWNAFTTARYVGTSNFIFYSNETSLGSTFFVNVTVTDATDLYAWSMGLVYDNTTLQLVKAWLPTDNVFRGGTASGGTLSQPPVVVGTVPSSEENAGLAVVTWGCMFIHGSKNWCFNGTGTVAQIEFRILKAPTSTTSDLASTFKFDPGWTTTIYWPTLDSRRR